MALKWIQKFIKGFGGDGEEITVSHLRASW
jgi:carboxylesterase type B